MAITRTSLLDLPIITTGTESGTWGDITNNGLTQYLDIAIAGMTSLTSANFTAGALTINTTEGDSSATNIAAGSAQYATIKVSSLAANSTITAPASNRSYRIVNADSTYSLTIKASGQTGVTFLPGQTGVVAFTGTDYEYVGVVNAASSTDNAIARFDSTTGNVLQNSGVTIDDSNNVSGVAQLNATTADLTNIEVTNIKAKDGTASASIADSTGVFTHATTTVFPAGSASTPAITTTGDTNTGIFFPAADTIAFAEGGAEAMRIDSDGDVGIGTNAPAAKLHVVGSGTYQTGIVSQESGQNFFTFFGSGNDGVIGTAGNIRFGTFDGTSERMRIDSSGNVGIGTSSPAVPLHVSTTGTSTSAGGNVAVTVRSQASGRSSTLQFSDGTASTWFGQVGGSNLNFGTDGTERARITSGGDLLVGTTSSDDTNSAGGRLLPTGVITSTLTASGTGDSSMRVYSTGAGAYRFYVRMDGTVFATNTTISGISDARYKENIRDLDVGLAEIMQLQPRVFDWKEGKGKNTQNDRGFIAQEVEQVFPDLIDEWKDPAPEGEEPYKSVRQDLIPVLVKAIQELKAELDTVKAELATLKGN